MYQSSFRRRNYLFTLPFCGTDWFPVFCDVNDVNAANIACVSRGFWWNDPNALGDMAAVGKNPKVGDDGGEKYEEGIVEW